MNSTKISRIASAGIVTGIATLAFAAPAQAMVPDAPGAGTHNTTGSPSGDPNWAALSAGGVGVIALAGAGVAVVRSRRHEPPQHT